ncbi:MAG: hypothetical protein OEX07_14270, partial [Gammaproteobacteria bacterium]|nr:hypothetical protein [Gammaproteobacteria bacterium]
MKHITKIAISAALLTSFSTASFADKGWEFFPGVKDDFIFDPTISVMAGQMQTLSVIGDAAIGAGIELSINCPLVQPPTNRVRQQISFFNYKDGDSTINTVELNPHYVVEVMPKLEIGAGPGFGFVSADVDGKTANMGAIQLGGSVHYRINKI